MQTFNFLLPFFEFNKIEKYNLKYLSSWPFVKKKKKKTLNDSQLKSIGKKLR